MKDRFQNETGNCLYYDELFCKDVHGEKRSKTSSRTRLAHGMCPGIEDMVVFIILLLRFRDF